jgi:MFS family permease
MIRYAAREPSVPHIHYPGAVNPFRDKTFLFILMFMLILGTIFVQVFNTWPIYLKATLGLSEPDIGTLLALNALLIVLVEMPLIHRIEKKNPMGIISLGAFLLFFGFTITPLFASYLFIAFTVIIWTTGEMLVFPLLTSLIANRANDHNRGKYMGMTTFTFALSFVVGPLFGTAIYDHFGGTVLWISIGFIGTLAFAGFRMLDLQQKKLHS